MKTVAGLWELGRPLDCINLDHRREAVLLAGKPYV